MLVGAEADVIVAELGFTVPFMLGHMECSQLLLGKPYRGRLPVLSARSYRCISFPNVIFIQ